MNTVNLKEKSTNDLKALAYDIMKTLKHYKGILQLIETELDSRAEKELEAKKAPTSN